MTRRWVVVLPVLAAAGLAVLLTRGGGEPELAGLADRVGQSGDAPVASRLATASDERAEEPAPAARVAADEPAPPALDGDAAAAAGTIRVRAVDLLSQEPIEGATVAFSMGDDEGERATGADGWCDTGLAPPARHLNLEVTAPGHARVGGRWSCPPELTLELAPLTTLRGRVLDADTLEPVEGAELTWLGSDEPVATLADGSFVARDYPAGKDAHLKIRAAGYGVGSFSFAIADVEREAARDFHLRPGTTFTGRVVDFGSRAPLAGAVVQADGNEVRTDVDGRFALDAALDPGEREVRARVEAEGYCQAWGPLVAGEELELPLPRTATLGGTVTDAEGQPAGGTHVRVHLYQRRALGIDGIENEVRTPLTELPRGWSLSKEYGRHRAETDAEGHYRIEGLRPWTPGLPVKVSGADQPFVVEAMAPPGGLTRLDVQLPPPAEPDSGGVVTGAVTVNGELEHVAIVQWRAGAREGYSTATQRHPYRIEGVSGPVELTVSLPVRLSIEKLIEHRSATVDVPAGDEVTHDFELTFERATITGRVVDTLGRPVAEHQVYANHDRSYVETAETDEDGHFQLDVPRGLDALEIGAGPLQDVAIRGVAPGTTGLELVVDLPGRLRFRALDPTTRAPVLNVDLRWRKRGAEHWRTVRRRDDTPDLDGFREIDVPAASLDLVFLDDDRIRLPAETTVTVPPDGVATAEVGMERGLTLELPLIGDAGPWLTEHGCLLLEPEHHAHVRFEQGGINVLPGFPPTVDVRSRVARWNAGTATLRGLPPGTYRFLVADGDPMPDPAEIELRESGQVVEVRWDAQRAR